MFITIGQIMINLDRITQVKFTEDGSAVYVYFDKDNVVTLDEAGAARLKMALGTNGSMIG